MARVVVLGAGIAGHTAALFLRKKLPAAHEVVVVTPNSKYNWIPSNIWVGVGVMTEAQVTFPLAPVYEKERITYKQAKAVSLHPEGGAGGKGPFVTIEYTAGDKAGQVEEVTYDYLINATGPRLNFDATEGLGPGKHSLSVCTAGHALEAAEALKRSIEKMKKGERQRFLIGTGHGLATCQGAAFEYLFNVEATLRKEGVRELADLVWLSNEAELGDFGMGGFYMQQGGYVVHSRALAESFYTEKAISSVLGAHVTKLEAGVAHVETLDGEFHDEKFDFAMLIPPFGGAKLKAFDAKGEDISSKLFNPAGFMFVDADYTPKPYEEWKASDWPKTYQTKYPNVFAAGISFAPPHPISRPRKTKNGTPVTPSPPRTGMPSAVMGRAVALSIAEMIVDGKKEPPHTASMTQMGAACVASAGTGFFDGMAVSMTVYPVVPDYERYPEFGRDPTLTFGEVGLAGHWIKLLLHYAFIYKAKAKPFWSLIPE